MTNMTRPIHVRVFYQIDPLGPVAGGIDSVIKGLAKYAPDEIEFSIVGLSSDQALRPVGKWTLVKIGEKKIGFFPVAFNGLAMNKGRIPMSFLLTAGMFRYWSLVSRGADILEFHRIEPVLRFIFDRRPKNLFIHTNMDAIYNRNSDIGWKKAPALFFALERFLLPRFDSVFGVSQSAINSYKIRYEDIRDRFRFIPTWFDPEIFTPVDLIAKTDLRLKVFPSLAISTEHDVIVSVGRLDASKNPILGLNAFAMLVSKRPQCRMIIVGDGVLRNQMEAEIKKLGLANKVFLVGLKAPREIADILRSADLYLMSSAYEGMPISVLEAIGTGLPVVSTPVGELARVVVAGKNGVLVCEHTAEDLSAAMLTVLAGDRISFRENSLRLASDYVPEKVLKLVYQTYIQFARSV